jgi:hypothetical protein
MFVLFKRTSFAYFLPRAALILLCVGPLLYSRVTFACAFQDQPAFTKDWQFDDLSGVPLKIASNAVYSQGRDIYILLEKNNFQKEILYLVFNYFSKKYPEPTWLTIEAFSDPEDLRVAIKVETLSSRDINVATLTQEDKEYYGLPSDLTELPRGFHAYFHRDAEREFIDYINVLKSKEYDRVELRDSETKENKEEETSLLERSKDINTTDKYGRTRLLNYLIQNLFDSARALIILGAEVNKCSPQGICPLLVAAGKGHAEIVGLLISKGANVNSKDKGGNTPLMRAVGGGFLSTAKLLLEHGANVNAKDALSITALMKAWDPPGKVSMTDLLLKAGANIDAVDFNGDTALMYAVRTGRLETVEFLLESGAQAKTKNIMGQTAIDYAKIAEGARVRGAKAMVNALQKALK